MSEGSRSGEHATAYRVGNGRTSYFDVFPDELTSHRPVVFKPQRPSKATRKSSDRISAASPRDDVTQTRMRRTRQASVRHSRAPSDAGNSPIWPYDDARSFSGTSLCPSISSDSAELAKASADIPSLPSSPGRTGRSRTRVRATSASGRRRREPSTEVTLRAKELIEKLENLSQQDLQIPKVLWTGSAAQSPGTQPVSPGIPWDSRSPEPISYYPFDWAQAGVVAPASQSPSEASSPRTTTSNNLTSNTTVRHGRLVGPDKASMSSIDEVVDTSTASTDTPPSRIPSIDELVRLHNARLSSLPLSTASSAHVESVLPILTADAAEAPDDDGHHSGVSSTRSSIDSIAAEVSHALKVEQEQHTPRPRHARSLPPLIISPEPSDRLLRSSSSQDTDTVSKMSQKSTTSTTSNDERVLNYLRSPRLTKMATVWPDSPGKRLSVSFADVGAESGHPVLVFLGLGSVRYLVGLYDELADALGLRLICIDRWGMGKTDNVSDDKRTCHQWALVVKAVLDQLGIDQFAIMAHSAGAPYALATSLLCPDRIVGSLHLLAPWVNTSVEGQSPAYKLLKLVPKGVISTAALADWKLTSWKLGKSPLLASPPGSGSDAMDHPSRAPVSSEDYFAFQTTSSDTPTAGSDSDDATPLDRRKSSHGRGRPSLLRFDSSSKPTLTLGFSKSPRSSLSRSVSRSSSHESAASSNKDKGHHSSDEGQLATALLRASHAETSRGAAGDLVALLEKSGKPLCDFAYSEIVAPCKVWHGTKDDRVSLASIASFSKAVSGPCDVKLVERADHNLMTNGAVMAQVLESVSRQFLM